MLEQYRDAGIGGVEICPIYGAKGFESRYIDYLSPKWTDMLAHTTSEAKRLGMGVDFTTGTGWPFGGPTITTEDAIGKVVMKSYEVAGGASLKEKLGDGKLQCLMAVSADGQQIDLTSKVKEGKLDWTAPLGQWRLYAVFISPGGMIVKRPAPGGEGKVIDPYSVQALDRYLTRFDKAFTGFSAPKPRSQFHDSFEYGNATWTKDFFQEFAKRRGYDLKTQLPALFDKGAPDLVARVKYDYRQTISDLHLAFVTRWTEWSHGQGSMTRNQAHGAPGNLIDLYAAADIPETESYKKFDDRILPMMQFASSAAHLSGRPLASSESFTWLGEHFTVPLGDVKKAVDFYFLAGINHIFYHGIPYSPKDAPWPGWQFYASVNFGPSGGLWRDLPEFNAYATRCQSILQGGKPANDVLLYFPIHDMWQSGGGKMTTQLTTPGNWMWGNAFHTAAMTLFESGFGYDEISDRFLAGAKVENGAIVVGSNAYRVVVVPKCKFMPETTLLKLKDLAHAGATIVFQDAVPVDVPGFADCEKRRAESKKIVSELKWAEEKDGIREGQVGAGKILVGKSIPALLKHAGVQRETMADSKVHFVRRLHPGGLHYFVMNHGTTPVDGWFTLGTPAKSVVILDPLAADRTGVAKVKQSSSGPQVYLQLKPGGTCVLRTFAAKEVQGRSWDYGEKAGDGVPVAGTWTVKFIDGGPVLPAECQTPKTVSWTTLGDAETKRFSGTGVYSVDFDWQGDQTKGWLLSLGKVCEAAKVRLNGKAVGALWSPPYEIAVGEFLRPGKNLLEVEVTNLAANRIADMDRRGVKWKIFRDANVAGVNSANFDASKWSPRDSGLLGPVQLIPIEQPQWKE
jgi:hypothetical protein